MAEAVSDQKPEAAPGADESAGKSTDVEYWKSEAKKAFEDRNKAIQKAKAYEDAQAEAERKRIEETGKFKEAYEKVVPELEQLRQFKSLMDERTKAKLAESEKALPEEHKAEYDKYIAKLPEDERIEWIQTRLGSVKTPPSSPASNRAQGTIGKTRDEISKLSPDERLALYRKDPEGFTKLMNG